MSAEEENVINTWEGIWKHVRPFGPWQITVIVVIAISQFFSVEIALMQSFASTKHEHYCNVAELANSTFTLEQRKTLSIPHKNKTISPTYQLVEPCHYFDLDYARLSEMDYASALALRGNDTDGIGTKRCDSWIFNTSSAGYGSSIQSDFELVCDRSIWLPTAQTIVMIGFAVGVFIWGSLSDRFGRRPIILTAFTLSFIFGIAIAFTQNYFMFAAFRAIQTLCFKGIGLVGYVLVMEVIASSFYRSIIGNAIFIPYAFGYMALPLFAYLFQDWRHLALVVALPTGFLFLMTCILPESPRWLAAMGRYEKAHRGIEKAAKWNGRTVPKSLDWQAVKAMHLNEGEEKKGDFSSQIMCLLRSPLMRVRTLLIVFNWIVNVTLYYGLSFYTVELAGNIYWNFFLGGLVELPAYLSTMYVYHRFGRRAPLALLLLVVGLCSFGVVTVQCLGSMKTAHSLIVGLVMTAKFSISCTFNMIYIYSSELYPTAVRSAAMGFSSMVSRFGSAAAPQLQHFGDTHWPPLTPLIFGVLSVLAAVSTLALPETNNRTLPQTVAEAERMARGWKPWQDNGTLVADDQQESQAAIMLQKRDFATEEE